MAARAQQRVCMNILPQNVFLLHFHFDLTIETSILISPNKKQTLIGRSQDSQLFLSAINVVKV